MLVVYEFLYSPKAQIKRLWKEIYKISFQIGKSKKIFENDYDPFAAECKKIIDKKEKMINALLEYYFDPENDTEYIQENKPSDTLRPTL